MTTEIALDDVTVDYSAPAAKGGRREVRRALDGITLHIEEGESFGLVGESGCGKSTTAKVIIGLTKPSGGTVRIGGEPAPVPRTPALQQRVQMVFQDPASSLNPRRRVRSVLRELILHYRLASGSALEARLDDLMDQVGLPRRVLDALPRDLSGGQRQRVAIARALAVEPRVLIADEAVSALDVSAQAKVINLLADLKDELGLTLIFISHDLAVVRTLCDRAAVMQSGRVVEVAPIEELFSSPQHDYTRRLLGAIPAFAAPRRRRDRLMTTALPVAPDWYRRTRITDTITRIQEPHVHEFLRANIWHVRGRDRDLVVDAGLGVASMREHLPELFANDPVLVVTHAHLDHAGCAHEFADRRMHAAEVTGAPVAASLRGPALAALLGLDAPGMPALLLDAVPTADFDVDGYALPAVSPTRLVEDGDLIDLGDAVFRVLHLPGHTPGSICLLDEEAGVLFSGDVLYDDVLLDDLHGSSIPDYVASLRRLRELDVRTVHPGHEESFDGGRMRELVDAYVSLRTSDAPE